MTDPTPAPPVPPPPPAFDAGCGELGLSLPPATLERLKHYLALLLEANQRMNLTAVRDPELGWTRHLLDGLSLLPALNPGESVVDVGSGGGVPGLVLALVDAERPVTLIEATEKKCGFLREAAEALDARNVSVECLRAEDAGRTAHLREQFDVATARALCPLPAALELLAPLVRPGGRILAMKGDRAREEIDRAAKACHVLGVQVTDVSHPLPLTSPSSTLVQLAKPGPLSDTYPRRNGLPAKRPL